MPNLTIALRGIQEARSADAVLEIVRRFLDDLSIHERAELPWGLAPEVIGTPADIALWALHFERGEGEHRVGPTYGRASKLLKEAGHRLSELRPMMVSKLCP